MELKRISTARGEFSYRQSSPAKPSAPLLVLLHGWPESSFCWEPIASHMDAFHLVAPDLRGLGDSTREGDLKAYSKRELAKDMLALLTELNAGAAACLCGHDWGGAVAQEMALLEPSSFAKLAILNMVIVNNPTGLAAAAQQIAESRGQFVWYQHFQRTPGLAEAMIPGREEAWLTPFLRMSSGAPFVTSESGSKSLDLAFKEYVRCYKIPKTAVTGANYYRAMDLDIANWASYFEQKFAQNCLYIYGDQDPVITSGYLDGAETCFPNGFTRIDLKAGHFVQEEKPAEVAKELAKFASA